MDRSEDKTVIRGPMLDNDHGNWLAKGYVLQGRYVIEAELGAGGFGITYLAKHRYLEDIWVAIKEYLPDGAATRDLGSRVHVISERYTKMYSWGLHRFLDEARLLRQFNHANIVSVQDFFEANNTAYLVMNYIRGRSLQTELDAGRKFDEENLRSIIYPLLDALQCIHREGLFHRDISPDNILLQEQDDTPVLIDFGSARYAMRMHGPEQINGGQVHTPTAIFKQGYSPIEQYEGTDQGPYTDIYALGATLYKAAFGTRPVDALKRSGELRLKKIDPLEPASQRGHGQFSKEFLQAIDSALHLEAEERPQTIEEWLEIFGKPAQREISAPYATAPGSSRRGLKTVIGGILAAGMVGLALFLASQYLLPTEEDIPTLLSDAAKELAKRPLADQELAEARSLYLQVLTLDHENTRALSGYSATNLLKQFSNAIEAEDLGKAAILLDKAERELQQTGIDASVLAPGRERLKLVNSRLSLRNAIRRQPLSPEIWPDISLLLDEMATLEGGKPLAETGRRGLQALKATYTAVRESDFDTAWSQVADAESQLSPLGISELGVARSEIQSVQREWQATRDQEIEALLTTAEQHLNQVPLTLQSLEQALTAYKKVRTLDPKQPRARVGLTISKHLVEALGKIQNDDFSGADKALSEARRASGNANLWNDAQDQTGKQLAAARQAWSLAQTRSSARALLVQAAEGLLSTPVNPEALAESGRLYQEALGLSQGIAELEAEAAAASAGSEFVAVLENTKQQLDNADFEGARSRLKSEETRNLSYRIGLGEPFLAKAEQEIVLAEIEWNLAQVKALLGENLLASEAQNEAQRHLERVLTLMADHSASTEALAAIESLRSVVARRLDHDYPTAIDALQSAEQALVALGIPANVFESTDALIRQEEATWTAQQRKKEIASRLSDAFGLLQRNPFDKASWERAESLFQEVSSIEGGTEQADAGQRLLAALQTASAATEKGRFDEARAQIAGAEEILTTFGIGRLDEARNLVAAADQKWAAMTQRQIVDALESAEQTLGGQAPSPELLQQTRQAYQAALDLDANQQQAQAGLILISLLEEFLEALQANDFDRAQESLNQAGSTAESAQLSPSLLEGANRRLSADRDAWNVDQARQQVLALRQRVTEQLSQQGISEERLAIAEKALQEAAVLSQSHQGLEKYTIQTTSGLEAVILLRALQAELAQAQFDAASKTLSDIGHLLSEAELDSAILKNATQVAVSAEIDWRLDDAARSLTHDLGLLISNIGLDTAEANYTAVRELEPDRAGVESALQGVADLRQMTVARTGHDYDQARALLDQAATELAGVGIVDNAFDPVRQRLSQEQQLWKTLNEQRNLNTWTSEAIGELNRSPFADATWKTVESLAERISATNPNDQRGLAVRGALARMQRVKEAIDAAQFAEARVQIEKAQSELAAIGVYRTLENAVRLLDSALDQTLKAQLQLAGDALGEEPLSEAARSNARSALVTVLSFQPAHPIAQAGVSAINHLQEANLAISSTEFAKSAKLLADADRQLRHVETNDIPMPQLKKAVADSRRELAKQRPSPGEIYPLISVALEAITSDLLGRGGLDTADKLLRNVLAMQADEPTALAGLQAVEQLRIASRSLTEGTDADAAAALKQAERLLVGIGLSPAVLEPAWRALGAIRQ